jgi:flagellar biosynthesis protein FliQ
MSEALLFDSMRQALWVSVVISAPVLTAALVVGLAIGLFQALTSVQEMTLTFVPKAAAMIAVFWATMTFMTGTLAAFFTDRLLPAISGG